jgi:signal peptidase I
MQPRRQFFAFLASFGFLDTTKPLLAATLGDWIESARVADLFVSARIPAKSYSMGSTKMMPTLAEGDVVLADLRLAGKQPARGELILSWYQGSTVYYRVVGLPGDKVGFRSGRLILNGREVAQEKAGTVDYATAGTQMRRSLFTESLPGAPPYRIARNLESGGFLDNIPETSVADGRLYLLGDNRDDSVDSRVASRGQVAIDQVIGRVVYRLRPNAGWLVPRESVEGLPKE